MNTRCACCGREEGRPDPGGRTAKGSPLTEGLPTSAWLWFEGAPELVIDIPWEDAFVLPLEVRDAIRSFAEQNPEGLVRCQRPGPEVTEASIRDLESNVAGGLPGVSRRTRGLEL